MESLGHYLKECRTQRGMSLDELATRTRIRRIALEALERDDYAALPVQVTVKGFLRAYARCVGIDEQEVLARYEQHTAEARQSADERPIGRVESQRPSWVHRLTLIGATLAVLAVVIAGFIALAPQAPPDHPASISTYVEPPAPTVVPGEAVPTPEALTPLESDESVPIPEPTEALTQPAAPESSAKEHRLTIAASETSWVHVIIDGQEQKEALLQPGERVTWAAAHEFRVTVGNAGGVAIALDGESVGQLGPSGRVRTLTLPRLAMNHQPDRPPALTSSPESATVPTRPSR